jgi:2-methylcitrate dehydratase PrpD
MGLTPEGDLSFTLPKDRPRLTLDIGLGEKVSCGSAAFANGELINALDYDALLRPPVMLHPT